MIPINKKNKEFKTKNFFTNEINEINKINKIINDDNDIIKKVLVFSETKRVKNFLIDFANIKNNYDFLSTNEIFNDKPTFENFKKFVNIIRDYLIKLIVNKNKVISPKSFSMLFYIPWHSTIKNKNTYTYGKIFKAQYQSEHEALVKNGNWEIPDNTDDELLQIWENLKNDQISWLEKILLDYITNTNCDKLKKLKNNNEIK